jgi:DNA-binding CsgD family transcriptional regulator
MIPTLLLDGPWRSIDPSLRERISPLVRVVESCTITTLLAICAQRTRAVIWLRDHDDEALARCRAAVLSKTPPTVALLVEREVWACPDFVPDARIASPPSGRVEVVEHNVVSSAVHALLDTVFRSLAPTRARLRQFSERFHLSAMEQRTLALLLSGHSAKESAARTGLSPKTIERQLESIRARTNSDSAVAVVGAFAFFALDDDASRTAAGPLQVSRADDNAL